MKTPREIIGELLNIENDYHNDIMPDVCVMCGFPINRETRLKMIAQALKELDAYYKKEER